MKDGTYISIVCKSDEDANYNFDSLWLTLSGINMVDGLPGNEILVCVADSGNSPYSLNQIREALKRPARLDMFELVTDPESGEQYRNWYNLRPKRVKRKGAKGKAA